MVSETDQLEVETEADRVSSWRTESLERAGWPHDCAVVLASMDEIDLHRACELLEHGCPIVTALEILT